MRLCIAGSRTINPNWEHLTALTKQHFPEIYEAGSEIVVGGARGVDSAAETWAGMMNFNTARFPADWKQFGRSAGMIRNAQMAQYADALLAFWDGESRGTANSIKLFEARGKRVVVIVV